MAKHTSPTYAANRATAPYNFIELPDAVMKLEEDKSGRTKHDRYVIKPGIVHSGYFECDLVTSSPLYIRGMMNSIDYATKGHLSMDKLNAEDQRKRAEFFRDAQNNPQIPASSLRGLVRNIYEIVTNGKMSRVSRRRFAYRSFEGRGRSLHSYYFNRIMKDESQTGEKRFRPRVRAGYMVRKGDEWFVQPACTIEGASFCRVSRDYLDGKYLDIHQKKRRNNTKQNRRIFVRPSPADYHAVKNGVSIWMAWSTQTSVEPRDGSYVECQIAPSNHINGKTSEAVIYPPDSTKALLPLKYKKTDRYGEIADVDVAADYQMQLTDGQIEKLGAQGVLQYDHPVFYTVDRDRDGNLVVDAIGHTMMMRLLYQWSPYDLLPPDFRSEESVDMAEGVFGYVRTAKQKNTDLLPAYSSRVTFTPGILQSSAESAMDSQPVIPYILSSPKPTTFQHYLAQSDPDDAQRHAHYDSSDATLRGHKLYWHKGAVRSEQIFDEAMKAPGKDLTSQHTLVKMVRPNVRFTFRVYFENLSNLELGALQYVLSIPASSGPYRYKLGMAKPLGAGAVSIDSHIHLMDRDARYQRLMEVDTDGTGSWLTGTVDEVTCQERAQKARVRFESVMLSRQTDAKAIDRLPRMQQLLHLLNFEKSSVADRGYMELPRFRERPVLPRPEKVK